MRRKSDRQTDGWMDRQMNGGIHNIPIAFFFKKRVSITTDVKQRGKKIAVITCVHIHNICNKKTLIQSINTP